MRLAQPSGGIRPRRRQGHWPGRRTERTGGGRPVSAARGQRDGEAAHSAHRSAHPIDRRRGAKNRGGQQREPDEPAPRRRSRRRSARRLGDRRQRARSQCVHVGARLCGVAGADAKSDPRAAARPSSGRSPKRAIATSAKCSSWARRRSCASRANAKAPSPDGSPRCGKGSRSALPRWRSPTSWRESAGRS